MPAIVTRGERKFRDLVTFWLVAMIAMVGLGIFLTGVLYDRQQSYQVAFAVVLALVVGGLLLATQVRSEVREN